MLLIAIVRAGPVQHQALRVLDGLADSRDLTFL
jgi:hypothetical protein